MNGRHSSGAGGACVNFPARARALMWAGLVVAMLLAPTAHASAQQAPAWAVRDAPVRIALKLGDAPQFTDAGAAVEIPDLGLVKPGGGDYALTGADGKPVPVAAVYHAPGQDTLLLARDLRAGENYYLYVGGTRGASWSPQTSLLMETRRFVGSRDEWFASYGSFQTAWNGAASQAEGAMFVPKVYAADNPFGEQTSYLSHFAGYLAPTSGDVELLTNSANASFILVNDQPFIDWTAHGAGNINEKTVRAKKLPASDKPVKIDYYQAKNGGPDPAIMTMGWRPAGGHIELVPESAFLHPGTTVLEKFESQRGAPVPAPTIQLRSYLGFGNTYLYEMHGALAPTDLTGATAEWRFDDGAVLTGTEVRRVIAGVPGIQHVTVTARRGADSMAVTQRLNFFSQPPKEAAGGAEEGAHARAAHAHYIKLLMELDPAKLDAAMLAAALPLLYEDGTDAQTAAFANPWLGLKPDLRNSLWLQAYSAHIRALALTDPRAAVAEVAANSAARQLYNAQLSLLELELLVFSVHDPSVLGRVQQLAFGLGAEEGKIGEIRVGDFYRLAGNVEQATAHYLAAQPPDPSGGRRLPAEDQANSITVEDFLQNATRREAAERLRTWELAHPMTKFTTNFLVLRARLLTLYGRWREALAELEAFPATHPDSPYQIDVDYYRARALHELGRKDEARKIWQDIAKNYPRSELAKPSLEWAGKP